jgi:hypothetical protein
MKRREVIAGVATAALIAALTPGEYGHVLAFFTWSIAAVLVLRDRSIRRQWVRVAGVALLACAALFACGMMLGGLTSGPGTQQYYANGYGYSQSVIAQNIIYQAETNGHTATQACTVMTSPALDPSAGQAGTALPDTGPTTADQGAWVQGCAAGYDGGN